jgi:hypothetical protein
MLLVLVYLPAGQGWQLAEDVLFVSAENVPASHTSQKSLPAEAWYLPAAHATHTV